MQNLTLAALILTTLSFLVALAWNDAFGSMYREVVGDRDTILTRVVYSIMLTVIAVWIFDTYKIKSKQQIMLEEHINGKKDDKKYHRYA